MKRKLVLWFSVLMLCSFSAWAHAEEFEIQNYTFTWHVTTVGEITFEIQKTAVSISAILGISGVPLSVLTISPVQANAVGEMLEKADEYLAAQKKSEDLKSKDVISAHNCIVTFSSSQGQNFEIEVKENDPFSPVVRMSRFEALEISKFLKKAEEMASFVDKRIRP